MKPGWLLLALIIGVTFSLSGCASSGTATPAVVDPTVEATITIPPTEYPTATTPQPAVTVLVAPEGSDPFLVDELQLALQDVVIEAGMQFRTNQTLLEQDFQNDTIQVVIALHPESEIESWVTLAPQTQFLAVGGVEIEPSANTSVIRSPANLLAIKTFLAGYIAAMITPDWRIAILSDANDSNGKNLSQAFTNGAHFYCGLCRSVYPPYPIPGYPLSMEIGSNSTPADLESVMEYFRTWHVKTIYVAPPVDNDELLQALSQAGFGLMAGRKPPQGLQSGWIVSLVDQNPAPMVLALYPDMVAGNGGKSMELMLEMHDVDSSLFTPGKQSVAEDLLIDLLGGFVGVRTEP